MRIGSTKWKRLIRDGAKAFDLDLDPKITGQFAVHAMELARWNRKTNLTAIKDPFEIAVKHFLDSVAPAALISPGASMLDIGSGGGFPGVPLKVLIPSLSVTLIDASRKKVNFLKHLIRVLDLKGIEARHVRAEDLAKTDPGTFAERHRVFENVFQVIICRALTSLDAYVRLSLPLLEKEGVIIALKGKVGEEEKGSVRKLLMIKPDMPEGRKDNFSIDLKKYTLPFIESERTMVLIQSS